MKKSISILFCLFMFPLFLNTSQVNAQSSVPSCLSYKSGDHAARIECFKKNEKEFRAQIKELRTKHNIEQVDYDSLPESCPSRSPGDHSARLECFKNNDNAYQAIINELMATEVGSAVDYNNEAKRFHESTTEGQLIQQLEAKISDLEGKLANAVSPTVYDDAVRLYEEQKAQLEADRTTIEGQKAQLEADRTTIEGQRQGINDLSNLLQESRAKHLALEDSYNQLETELAGSRKSLDELTIQIEAKQEAIKLISSVRDQFYKQRNEQRDANEVLRTQLTERSDQVQKLTAQLRQTTAELADSQRELQAARQGPPPIQRVIGGKLSCTALQADIKANRPEASGWTKSKTKYKVNGKWVHGAESPCLWPE